MTFTYDLTTDIGKIRMLSNDRTAANEIHSDEEIAAFMSLEGSNVKRSAALALETIASSEVLVQKVIRLLDLSTNGASESAELLKRAAILRAEAAAEEDDIDGGVEIAEMIVDQFSLRESTENDAIREDEA